MMRKPAVLKQEATEADGFYGGALRCFACVEKGASESLEMYYRVFLEERLWIKKTEGQAENKLIRM